MSSPYKELLLGAGSSREKRVYVQGRESWSDLTTLDFNSDHKPDVEWDLERLPLPFPNNEFDEIHAYEVLEHTGQQGDWKFFFSQFSDFWRILKPGGLLFGTCPSWKSAWAWGDPSHKRVISNGTLVFLSQKEYDKQVGKTPMTDYRFFYKADLERIYCTEDDDKLVFILRANKEVDA